MKRRTFLSTALAATTTSRLLAALADRRWDAAADVLQQAANSGQVRAAVLHVVYQQEAWTQAFGEGTSNDAMFLLGSIS